MPKLMMLRCDKDFCVGNNSEDECSGEILVERG